MNLTARIAKQLRDVHFGGNWTDVNLKDTLADVSWQQATKKIDTLNTIATLVYHMNYYLNAVLNVLQEKPLDSKHQYSFNMPPISSLDKWNELLKKNWRDVETLASIIEQLPESRLWEIFYNEKYGTYYRNIEGIIEHSHYHLGQIVLIKKMLLQNSNQ
jgi:hypothetical protein